MKENYENRTRYSLPRRTYTVLRIDGKAFHTYARDCERPFDEGLIADMQNTAKALCESIQGCKLAYTQSDEISLVLTDFDQIETEGWFDGNLQKMVSISASIATSEFNKLRLLRKVSTYTVQTFPTEDEYLHYIDPGIHDEITGFNTANFDSRAFTISSRSEVMNYLFWRQQDASKNSVSMVARSFYSHKELEGKSTNEMQEMIFQKSGKNWNNYPTYQKRGSCAYRAKADFGPEAAFGRAKWIIDRDIPIFSSDWTWLENKIPLIS